VRDTGGSCGTPDLPEGSCDRRADVIASRPTLLALLAMLAMLVVVACGTRRPDRAEGAPRETTSSSRTIEEAPDERVLAARGAELVVRFECARCHDALGRASEASSCTACHRRILDGTFDAASSDLRRWQRSIRTFVDVPTLATHANLRRSFVRSMLLSPTDQRPGLGATMPRLAISEEEAEAIAAFLVPADHDDPLVDSDARRGQSLYETLGCASCHRFGSRVPEDEARRPTIGVTDDELARGRRRAPDLALTRVRLAPSAALRMLVDPRAVVIDTPMPDFELDARDALDLLAFVMTTPVEAPMPSPAPTRAQLPIVGDVVDYETLDARVLHRSCRHCHADADFAFGDGGAGNTGGFGFAGRGVELDSRIGLHSGYLDDDGHRRSLFAPMADGTPRIVAALLARHAEVAGSSVPGIRGMPLAMPPLPLEDIALVDAYVRGQRP